MKATIWKMTEYAYKAARKYRAMHILYYSPDLQMSLQEAQEISVLALGPVPELKILSYGKSLVPHG
jgi:hypothetical protein